MYEFVGIDGCRAGWFAISLMENGSWTLAVYRDFVSLWRTYNRASLLLVDMPIGLIGFGSAGRECDTIARRLLGAPRASSVFTPPTRPALLAAEREQASELNRTLTGRRLSIQAWAIAPKIREVDAFLRSHTESMRRIREVHPELLFWALNGRRSMAHTKRSVSGYGERLAVLQRFFKSTEKIAAEAISRFQRSAVGRDDVLDALAAAVVGYLSKGDLLLIPDPAPTDECGIPMEMVYYFPESR